MFTRVFNWLLSLLVAAVAASNPTTGDANTSAAVPPPEVVAEREALEKRLNALREKLTEEDVEKRGERLVQWPNWRNGFRNWRDWRNW